MEAVLERKEEGVVNDRYWTEWFVGFERKQVRSDARLEDVLPVRMRQARSLNQVRMYVETCMACW